MNKEKENQESKDQCNINSVSESFRKEIRIVMEHHLEEEKKHSKMNNYTNAMYHSTFAGAMQEVLLRAVDYSR